MSRPLRVLILDDSEGDALLLVHELKRGGFDPAHARVDSAPAMRAALLGRSWDIILSDYAMPAFTALDALKLLHDTGLDLPFIIVSSTINEIMAVNGLKAGAHDFVVKGNYARLVPAIERELRQARSRQMRQRAEQRLATTMDAMAEGARIIGFDWRYLYINKAGAAQARKTVPELVGRTMQEAIPGVEQTALFAVLQRSMAERVTEQLENEYIYPDGGKGWFHLSIEPVPEGLFILSQEITERKRAEAELAGERQLLRTVIDNVPDFIYAKDTASRFTLANQASANSLGRAPDEMVGKTDFELHPRELAEQFLADEQKVLQTGQALVDREEMMYENGQERWQLTTTMPLCDSAGQVTGLVGISRNITERKRADDQIQNQLARLAALREIDQAINGSLDLTVTLNVCLGQVVTQLSVDAADVLLLEPRSRVLEYAAGRGFRSPNFQQVNQRVGEGRAGQVVLERRIVASDLRDTRLAAKRTALLGGDAFASYYGAPLIAKGQMLGVLEIFHRSPLRPTPEWLEFLEAVASQAAIAIDNARLFDSLQDINQELVMAYDATIAGWSRALDQRDKETEGHSRRVTELSQQLARSMGVSEQQLVHMQRGALLHDIGKIGVPDHILLKPGPLTDDEWVIMRRHPVLAYEMLEPIRYLHPALEIPYCHHEKWDGTGYPRGLKGEQIPLVARLFAVVDVWDALRSDRTYRRAWPAEQVRAYIREQAGQHFDPAVVEAFLRLEFTDER